jgi:hypothetical protein
MITISNALHSIRPNSLWTVYGTTYSGLVWSDTVQTKPTEQEVNAEIARLTEQAPFTVCKDEAKKRIAATDWSVLPDVNISNKAEFETYRAALRILIITPVATPTFPTEPQPVWI